MRTGQLLLAALIGVSVAQFSKGAELSVGNLVMSPAATETLVVSGDIAGESTFGVSVLVEIVPRAGAVGVVSFTPSPPVDITQLGDPWPGVGTFSTYDADITGSLSMNGIVDDNGTFVPGAVTYSGELAGLPVIASGDAEGVWDVLLATTLGDSTWEGLTTTLTAGTITVENGACNEDPDCTDYFFCTGVETCDNHTCVPGTDPCPGQLCNEVADACVDCLGDGDCDDGTFCNTPQVCDNGTCVDSTAEVCPGQLCDEENDRCVDCLEAPDCDDGDFCNGAEVCVGGTCQQGADPCPTQACDEVADDCVPCQNDPDCDDGRFCNGTETCDVDTCVAGTPPCPDQGCDEDNDICIESVATLTADNVILGPGGTASVTVSGEANGISTYGVSIQIELVPRAGASGTLTFTTSPPNDISQLGDPWPGLGTFSGYDTTDTSSDLLNGSVDDNGTFVPGALTFSGPLSSFPVVASGDADGIWDVLLTTSLGDSTWEGVTTTLVAGTVRVAPATSLTVQDTDLSPGGSSNLVVLGDIDGESTFGVNILVQLIPRSGTTGSVTFTAAPPVDITQSGDPWPSLGEFTAYDTDTTGSSLLNGCIDDNGTYIPGATTYVGPLASFPIECTGDASGVWDVVLSTTSGDSGWEGIPTALYDGTITVTPTAALSIRNMAIQPNTTGSVLVRGEADGDATYGVTVLVELVPRAGTTGTVTFTPAPPVDILEGDDPWPLVGGFTAFDTDSTGSTTLNGCVGDNGTFLPAALVYSGDVAEFPVIASADADGVWDVLLTTSQGTSGWEGVTTGLTDGTLTVTADACILDTECEDNNECTDNTCDAGLCVFPNNVLPCDDNLRCTVDDVCSEGVCAGTPVDCSALDEDCLVGTCNPVTGSCYQEATNDGGTCDDGDLCTENDVCSSGSCAGDLIDCSHLNDQCVQGWCRPFDGVCDTFPANTNLSCSDGDACTTGDRCIGGVCTGTPISACTPCIEDPDCDDDNECTNEFCHGAGVCIYTNREGSCDDGSLCTLDDTCDNGECVGTPDFTCVECHSPIDCIDNNECTDDVCSVVVPGQAAICQNPYNSNPCDDGDICTTPDTCVEGTCQGTPVPNCSTCEEDVDCDDENECTTDSCHPTIHICLNIHVQDATVCDDEDPCTDGDACQTGVCVGNPMADDSDCDDSNVCTTGTTCQSGICTNGTATDCTHLDDDCNTGTCHPVSGECEAIPSNEGGLCTENCIVEGACYAGDCVVVTPLDCTHLDDQCNEGACNAETGVCEAVPTNEGNPCSDGLLCTTGDACNNGVCEGQAVTCEAYEDDCNSAVCNPANGNCETTAINEGGNCEDDNLCTENETCAAGVCSGSDVDCSHLDDECVEGICNPANGACTTSPINQGLTCSDDDLCTENDVCQSGICVGSDVDCTAFEDTCNSAACNPANGACEQTPINEGQSCTDGLRCTLYDQCTGGSCIGIQRDCSTLDSQCSEGECNATTGQCEANPINEGDGCDDGLPCTSDDTCVNGVCVGSGAGPGLVNLTWQPATPSILLDNTFQMSLVATASTCEPQSVGSIYAVIRWDDSVLALTGNYEAGPYDWPFHGFPDDSYLDGLNAPYTGAPDNDGDAWYSAGAQFFEGAEVTDAGLVVATFEFMALDTTDGIPSVLYILPVLMSSETLVLEAETGLDITGIVGGTSVTVVECFQPEDCDDANSCTTEVCDVDGVCHNNNNTIPCDDGLFCTSVDVCGGGTCNGSVDPCTAPDLCSEALDACVECLHARDCDDENVCTTDSCDATGSCVNANNTVPCDDELFCTAVDICSGGICIGSGDTCDGLTATPHCDEPGDACVECLQPEHCDDGTYCNGVETCIAGVCGDGPDPCAEQCYEEDDECVECLGNEHCDDENECTIDICSAAHTCTVLFNSDPCEDDLFCTLGDYCSGGSCQPGTDDPCPGQLCDDTNDRCVDCFVPSDCDDGISCTYSVCDDGECVFVTDDVVCDDGEYCNGAEYCDAEADCVTPGNPCDYQLACDEVNDLCGCDPPTVEVLSSRYIAVTPAASELPEAEQWGMAIRVSSPAIPCLPMYAGVNGLLQETPVFQTQAEWGTAYVRGIQIIPSTEYTIDLVLQRPGDAFETLSNGVSVTTAIWGDVCGATFDAPPNNAVNLTDILYILNAFGESGGIVAVNGMYAADLIWVPSTSCAPNGVVNLTDILQVIEAFSHQPVPPYPDSCAEVCP